MSRLPKLSDAEIEQMLAKAPGWSLVSGQIEKKYRFKTFADSMRFVNRVATAAEAADHHPDLAVHFNQVVLRWITHGSHGLTQRDFEMAAECDRIADPMRA